MFGSLLEPLSATRQLLIDGLVASLVLAIIVAIISETLRNGLQRSTRERMFREWWGSLDEARRAISDRDMEAFHALWLRIGMSGPAGSVSGLGNESGVHEFKESALQACELPNELFMRKVENMGRAVLERPSERPDLFIALTTGVAADEKLMVLRFDQVMRYPRLGSSSSSGSPPVDGKTSTDPQTVPPAVLAAQDRTASALDRNLDDLQLRFAKEWPVLIYTTSFLIGFLLSLLVAVLVNGFKGVGYFVAMGMIGAAAGLLAAVARDSVSRFVDERRTS
jgi:hypothetical protein